MTGKLPSGAGGPALLVVPGVVAEDVRLRAAFELSKKSLREALPLPDGSASEIALENVWNKFLLSPLEFRDYVDSFSHELIRRKFRRQHPAGAAPRSGLTSGRADRQVHVKEKLDRIFQFVGLLRNNIDYPRAMNALRGAGYDGYVTAELFAVQAVPCAVRALTPPSS